MHDFIHSVSETVKSTPEILKVGAALSAPGLTLLGVPVEDWSFILASVVSGMVILEKSPIVVKRIQTIYQLGKRKYALWRSKAKRG